MEKPTILIGVLRERFALWPFVDSLTYMCKHLDANGVKWATVGVRTTNIYKGRERIADMMFDDKLEYTHLLFIDSDQTFVPATALHLVNLDLDIVSGLVFQRSPPHLPCIYRRVEGTDESLPLAIELAEWFEKYNVPAHGQPVILDEPDDESALMRVDETGTGCLMIRRHVFEALKKPFFTGNGPVGTDLMYARRCRAAGFDIWVDPRCQLGHITNYQVTAADFRKTQKWRVADPNDLRDE